MILLIIIECLALIGILVLAFDLYLRFNRRGRMINKLPGPPAYPIVGNLFRFITAKQEEIMPFINEVHDKYYPICRFWVSYQPAIEIYHPDYAEVMLSNVRNISKAKIYDYIKPWLKTGLLTSKGKQWKHRRQILTPAFHFNILKQYNRTFVDQGAKLAESLKKSGKQENVVDLISFCANHTLSIICETTIGTSLDLLSPKELHEYREAIKFMGDITVHRHRRPWLANDFIFKHFTTLGWRMKKQLQILHGLSSKIYKERLNFHEKTGRQFLTNISKLSDVKENRSYDGVYKMGKKKLAMLDLLIAAKYDGLIDDEGILEELDTFIFEGHDTTAMALCSILQQLGEYPDIQEKARKEVNEVWESADESIDMSTLTKLTYLEQCIKEALRIIPSVPFISRVLDEDLHLKDYLIPAGVTAQIYILAIHRDANYWPDPMKFDPDRFSPEKVSKRHPFSYIPFSGGPRNCIGQKFAMMEIKTVCCYILRNFYLQAQVKTKDLGHVADLVYRPAKKWELKFIAINK